MAASASKMIVIWVPPVKRLTVTPSRSTPTNASDSTVPTTAPFSTVATTASLWQLHEHFTSSFSDESVMCNFSVLTVYVCIFWQMSMTNKKAACKMLVKLEPFQWCLERPQLRCLWRHLAARKHRTGLRPPFGQVNLPLFQHIVGLFSHYNFFKNWINLFSSNEDFCLLRTKTESYRFVHVSCWN